VLEHAFRASLHDESHQADARLHVGVERNGLIHELLELSAILIEDRLALRKLDIRAGQLALLDTNGFSEMFARRFRGAAQLGRLAVERDEQLVDRAVAPLGIERERAIGERAALVAFLKTLAE